jgi:hypothetical protein
MRHSAGITGIVKAVLVVHMKSPDFTYDRVDLTIWTLAEPAASIMAICIPILYESFCSTMHVATTNRHRRMLYREIKSSKGSYFRNISQGNAATGATNGATESGTAVRKSQKFGGFSKYGQNSVVIMSTAGWQDSEEALQDAKAASGVRTPPPEHGVMRTAEIRVNYENSSTTSGDESIEMAPMPAAHRPSGRALSQD